MYLLNMPYWYSYTREIHNPTQFFMHSWHLSLWRLGLSPIRILHVVEVLTTYKIQVRERPSLHSATYPECMKTAWDYESLSYTSTNKACSASPYNSETLTLTLILTLTLRYIKSVRVRVCGRYLLIMRYSYSYTRESHSPIQFFMHSGYLALCWSLSKSHSVRRCSLAFCCKNAYVWSCASFCRFQVRFIPLPSPHRACSVCNLLALWVLSIVGTWTPSCILHVVDVLTTYKIRLGERPSPHNAKYPQCKCTKYFVHLSIRQFITTHTIEL